MRGLKQKFRVIQIFRQILESKRLEPKSSSFCMRVHKFCKNWTYAKICKSEMNPFRTFTCNSLMATHEFSGNPCNIGTKNWRHPDQWPMSNIMQIRLNILMNTLAIFKNWKQITQSRMKRKVHKKQLRTNKKI